MNVDKFYPYIKQMKDIDGDSRITGMPQRAGGGGSPEQKGCLNITPELQTETRVSGVALVDCRTMAERERSVESAVSRL